MLKAPARPAVPKYERLMTSSPVQDPLVDAIYRFLWSNYNHPIGLADLATAVAYSPAYLCRHFRQKTGETPFQALRRIRLEVAKRLLTLNLSVATVA
jgi:transcriptional regulator GlxA family with amidase domain